jgi:hypothetical protein
MLKVNATYPKGVFIAQLPGPLRNLYLDVVFEMADLEDRHSLILDRPDL